METSNNKKKTLTTNNTSNSNNKSNTNIKRNYRRTQGPQHFKKNTDSHSHSNNNVDANDNDDNETCLICAEKLKYVALSPCNHMTCHKCSFRQRALYKKNTCLICRSEMDKMIFSDNVEKQFNDYDLNNTDFIINTTYNIHFTSTDVSNCTLNLLEFHCKDVRISKIEISIMATFKKLNAHLNSDHGKTLCMICALNKNAFAVELPVFTQNQLRNHQQRGDNKGGFKGHPICAFCSGKRFYGDDELYLHMRQSHEKCHICDKLNPQSPQYFKDYDQLFDHFKAFHFVCTFQSCLDCKFVVFGDEIELQAHILKEHGDIIRGKPKLFQSELSTFISAPSRVIREGDQLNNPTLNSNSLNDLSNVSPEVKRLRLEQRAKHYLNNSREDYETFEALNNTFDKNEISGADLLVSYKSLFKSENSDVYLLINNLSQIYPSNSNKHKELKAIYDQHERTEERKTNALPSLSRDGSFNGGSGGIWTGASGSSGSSSGGGRMNTRNLPTLQAKSASHDVFARKVRTQPVKPVKTVLAKKKAPVSYSTITSGTNSSNAISNSVQLSATSLERLSSSSPNNNSRSSSNWGNSSSSNNNKSNDKLKSMNLQSLPTPKPKVYIPPVKETNLPDPKKWGKEQPSNNQNRLPNDLESLSISSTGKKGKKQKQLLFHIGV
ncbi:hypothetical protein TBLA_0A09630 [Henningerozyma blattae CBS 6284]|uniref:RING-type E3 ubiquitin transferase n=1 Tax=Henningerozyma blattae (strain ATCC 34711 / CBS 6284 / DSM 70876 / NBRC 10599 / NRRL Y-10934 / UCD 77-7) TaxID=1071380 RepID=I2GX95_HENB6|nr:hypothetical protein TBLA_0A09630 [Tetrapisispora blattae CBS 6284]CCH58747.1 hypothetical protein TBLA_0A09630 [Tetrapisispora blattae CBS 6284]